LKKSLLFLVLPFLMIIASCSLRPLAAAAPVEVPTPKPASLVLNSFRQIDGTDFFIAEISEKYRPSLFSEISSGINSSSARYSYSGDAGRTHNLVFLESASLAQHRLLETNTWIVLDVGQYPLEIPACPAPSDPCTAPQHVVKWLLYQLVKADTNQDGQLSEGDQITLALTDAGGKGYTELITGVTHIYWINMKGTDQLSLIYRVGGKKWVSVIDLANSKVTETNPFLELGPEVE